MDSFSPSISFYINLFITLDSMLQKKSSEVQPHYMDVSCLDTTVIEKPSGQILGLIVMSH
jgi:hypothetical protein